MLGWSMVVNTKYLANPGGQRPLVEIAQVSIFAVDSTVVVDGLGVRRVLFGRRLGVDASPQHHFAEGTEKHEQFKLVFNLIQKCCTCPKSSHQQDDFTW